MPRYFLEVAYKGTGYSGFQIQDNAPSTIQQEVEAALETFFRRRFTLTGSSRTDAGVHAVQNFFHFDYEAIIDKRSLYNINAILPPDIVLKDIRPVAPDAHCRFDALSREYRYYIYRKKDPFLADRAWFFPYTIDRESLDAAARLLPGHQDFTSFSKRRTQVKTFHCTILDSVWEDPASPAPSLNPPPDPPFTAPAEPPFPASPEPPFFAPSGSSFSAPPALSFPTGEGVLVYRVVANRFLRGMVRGLVGTMLQVGRGRLSVEEFAGVLRRKDNRLADFSAPGHGLFLFRVSFPDSMPAPAPEKSVVS